MMRRTGNANSFIGHNIDTFPGRAGEAMARIDAQIRFMMSISNVERLGQFSRAGAKIALIVNSAPFLHQLNPTQRLHRTN
jgi:hypothetical protein